MKNRVTITLDPEISHRARLEARRRGTSFFFFFEQLLSQLTCPAEKEERPTFSERWAGKGDVEQKQDLRSRRLFEKYGL